MNDLDFLMELYKINPNLHFLFLEFCEKAKYTPGLEDLNDVSEAIPIIDQLIKSKLKEVQERDR